MRPSDYVLAIGMLVTGSLNTLSTKLADTTKSKDSNGDVVVFDHPFTQAAGMFIGEFLCLIAFKILYCINSRTRRDPMTPRKPGDGDTDFPAYIFILPAFCDMCGTSLMYLGLTYTYASVFQMLRGSVILFTGVMSVLFLKAKLLSFHWLGIAFVIVGTLIVGASSVIGGGGGGEGASNPILGDILIVCAQLVVSFQMVVEEKFLSKYNIPALQAVGWEGAWGFLMLSCVLVGMYFMHWENSYDAFVQIGNNGQLAGAISANIVSIAFFNFFGISVTKAMSASHRMVLDSLRTVVIWGVSLALKWEDFSYLQVIGFVVLLAGTMVYNQVVTLPCLKDYPSTEIVVEEEDEERDPYARSDEQVQLLAGTSAGMDPLLARQRYYRTLHIRFDHSSIQARRISGEF